MHTFKHPNEYIVAERDDGFYAVFADMELGPYRSPLTAEINGACEVQRRELEALYQRVKSGGKAA